MTRYTILHIPTGTLWAPGPFIFKYNIISNLQFVFEEHKQTHILFTKDGFYFRTEYSASPKELETLTKVIQEEFEIIKV